MPAFNVSAISHPEFININSLSPFAAKCQIKVFYIGQNRNKSFITKEVATNMAQTLPGCPIVGYYKEAVGDFRDHGDVATIEEGKINVEKKTQPFGFIAPDAKVWFQNFEESDEYGNTVIREYLVAEGYLWTQFTGADLPLVDGGRPQSMELDEKSLDGYWSNEFSSNIEFFIINDAKFKALCILGEDVEPCFEGSNVTRPDTYSFDTEDLISGLGEVMKQLQFTLNKLEGGNQKMAKIQGKVDEQSTIENQNSIENFVKSKEEEKDKETNTSEDKDEETQDNSSDEKEDEEKKKKVANNSLAQYDEDGGEASEGDSDSEGDDTNEEPADTEPEEPAEEEEDPTPGEEEEEEPATPEVTPEQEDEESLGNTSMAKLKEKYSLLEKEYADLQIRFSTLEESYNTLVEFKNQIEDSKKDDMINSFYMLDDVDKKDVIENKSKYTLDEIESKLSVICVRKKVNFDLGSDKETEDEVPTTYDLNGINSETVSIPAWLKAVEETQNRNK